MSKNKVQVWSAFSEQVTFKEVSSKKEKFNQLNGVPLGSNLDDFDVIGGSDLFRGAQGYQDDR